jgi:ribosome assembly protein YihI (activator of Der GTPase)
MFGFKKKKFFKPEERIQNLMEKLGIKQEYEEIKA